MTQPAFGGRLVGYARVSTDDQELFLQMGSLIGLGVIQDDIFTDKVSGTETDRPSLGTCLAMLQRGDIVSPSMPAKGTRQGKLTLEDLELDDEGRVLRCPMGQVAVETSVADVRLQVLFDSLICERCPRRGDCAAAAVGRRERRWQYTHDRVRQRARRLGDASEEFRKRYRWRAGIEATMSRFKYQMGMARLRVRGMAKVTYVAMLRALGLNNHRVAAYRAAIG